MRKKFLPHMNTISVLLLGIVLFGGNISCSTSTPNQDKPRYTSSEIVATVRNDLYNNVIYRIEDHPMHGWLTYPVNDANWQTSYVGAGKWRVQSTVTYTSLNTTNGFKNPYAARFPNPSILVWVFYENSGVVAVVTKP